MRSACEAFGDGAVLDERMRLVVSAVHGSFLSAPVLGISTEGEFVESGQLVGSVTSAGRTTDVRSPWRAWVIAYLVRDGDRVRPGTPLVHLEAM